MRTAVAVSYTASPGEFCPVWLFPRRPSGWHGPHITLGPWLPPQGGWSDRLDPIRFARELVADLRERDVHRYWAELHATAAATEPVLVTAPAPVLLCRVFRRTVASWFERAGKGTVPELGPELPTVQGLIGLDPWTWDGA